MGAHLLARSASPLLQQSARAMVEGQVKGAFSAQDLMRASLDRAHEVNPQINAFCLIDDAGAMAKALQADRAREAGKMLGPLHGVPFAVKDLTPTKGHLTTRGSWSTDNWIPDETALCIARLEAAGGIVMGKTTTPEFAFSGFTQSPRWGVTRNPWDLARTPGGSSGGSGAAVASGCVPFAEGTDMGGSVRIPAACCGVVGLKPSLGRIPMTILPTVFDSISHFGPLARRVEDATLFMEIASGPSDADIQSLTTPFRMTDAHIRPLAGRRFAYSLDQGYYDVDAGVAQSFARLIDKLRGAGAVVEKVDLRWTREINDKWSDYWCVFMASLFGEALDAYESQMDPNVVAGIKQGRTMSAVEFKSIELFRTRLWADMAAIFASYEFFLSPTCAITAPLAAQDDNDFVATLPNGRYGGFEMTCAFNLLAACPAMSLPIDLADNGLPVGLQIVGKRFDDEAVLGVGALIEALLV